MLDSAAPGRLSARPLTIVIIDKIEGNYSDPEGQPGVTLEQLA